MPMTIDGNGSITGLTAGGLPDATIVQADLASGVAGNGPAFSAYVGSNQSFSASTWTKITYDTEEFDTNSNYASSRFTPTVAGYYQLTAAITINFSGSATLNGLQVYKNGSQAKLLGLPYNSSTYATGFQFGGTAIVYMNGSTDYVEIYAYCSGTSPIAVASSSQTYFQGSLVRAA